MTKEKENKILNKINYDSGQSKPVKVKNDEMYTSMDDILSELKHYKKYFENKNIICPCDWDIVNDNDEIHSIKITFSDQNPSKLKIENNIIEIIGLPFGDQEYKKHTIDADKIDDFLREKLRCSFLRVMTQYARQWKIKSVTASGFNPITGQGKRFQEIDFSQYDICITNPPFSMYNEFLSKLLESKIDFIILAPFLNRVNPNVGLPLMLRKCYLGFGRKLRLSFKNYRLGEVKEKVVAVDWITTFRDAQDEIDKKELKNGIKYEDYKEDYPIMVGMTMKDGTHPIRINNFRALPDDYYGWAFTSIGILDVLSYKYFEWYITNAKTYFNRTNPSSNPFSHKVSNQMLKDQNNKQYFHGIIIKRKNNIE